MEKTELIKELTELEQGNALVLLTDRGPIELINGSEAEDTGLVIFKESIRTILDETILDACVMPVGRKYINYEGALVFVDKVYQVDEDEHCIAEYPEDTEIDVDLAKAYAKRYVDLHDHLLELEVEWDIPTQQYTICVEKGYKYTSTYEALVSRVEEGLRNA